MIMNLKLKQFRVFKIITNTKNIRIFDLVGIRNNYTQFSFQVYI